MTTCVSVTCAVVHEGDMSRVFFGMDVFHKNFFLSHTPTSCNIKNLLPPFALCLYVHTCTEWRCSHFWKMCSHCIHLSEFCFSCFLYSTNPPKSTGTDLISVILKPVQPVLCMYQVLFNLSLIDEHSFMFLGFFLF